MKLMKVLVAALVMAAMVVPAIAEDRLQLSGEMRVRGHMYDTDNSDFGGLDDSGAWNDQRLRVMGKLAVAEGVNVVFRFDATESDENSSDAVAWGGSSSSAYQYSQRRGDIQFDLAYLSVEKNGFTLMAGELYFGGFGYTAKMMDVIGAGFIGKYGAFTLGHIKRMDENQGKNTFTGNYDGDASLTAAKYDFKGEGVTLTPMIAYNADDHTTKYDLLGVGLAGSATLGPVLLKGEFNYFDGETDAYKFYPHALPTFTLKDLADWSDEDLSGTDVEGLQLYLDASMAASDNVRVGLQGFFAKGQDDAIQATNMNRDANVLWTFADYHPESYGYWSTEFVDEFYDIYDPAGTNGGVIAAQLYADVKASENTSLKFAAMYFQNEDDALAKYDGYTLNAGISYQLAKNTTLTLHANYIKYDFDEIYSLENKKGDINEIYLCDVETDTLQMFTGIAVKF